MPKFSFGLLAILLLTSCHVFKSSDLYVAVSKTQAAEKSSQAGALEKLHGLLLKRGIEHKIVKFRYEVAARPILAAEDERGFLRGETPLAFAPKRRTMRERRGIVYRDDADLGAPWWYVDGEVRRPIWLPPVRVAMQVSFAMRRRIELLRTQEFDRAVAGMTKNAGWISRDSDSFWNERFRRANGTDFDPASPLDAAKMRALRAG